MARQRRADSEAWSRGRRELTSAWSRRSRLGVVVAVLMWTVLVGLLASPASANGVPKFKGDAPGLVVCNLSATVGFSPAITESGGGTNASSVKGKLSGCVASNSDVTITSGAVKGSFASSPLDCATSSATGSAATLTVTWKGDFNGTVGGTVGLGGIVTGGTTYAGAATYTSSKVSAGTVTGSFTGNSTVTVNVPSNLTASCEAKKGAKKLALTGTLAVGATSGPGGGGGGGSLPTDAVQIVGEGHSSGLCGHTSCGTYCAVTGTGHVDCWGLGLFGQLGDNAQPEDSNSPQLVDGVGGTGSLSGVARLAAAGPGDQTFCAVLTSGGVDCWGYDGDGEAGDAGAAGAFVLAPIAVPGVDGTGTLTGVVSAVGFGDGYCALLTSSGVDCWGQGERGFPG